MNAVALSIRLLRDSHESSKLSELKNQLSNLRLRDLENDLQSTDSRKAFFINCYNAFVRILLTEKKPDLCSPVQRNKFFSAKLIYIGGYALSLNNIEHGLLRHSKIWWSFGYLPDLFPGDFEKKFRLPLDYRIHFALNCGASSCPPIRYYEPEKLHAQLTLATESFLSAEVDYNASTKVATVSKILKWYLGDFGGEKGIKKLLFQQQLIPSETDVRIAYKNYDWNILLKEITD